jgi:hypothetical protein
MAKPFKLILIFAVGIVLMGIIYMLFPDRSQPVRWIWAGNTAVYFSVVFTSFTVYKINSRNLLFSALVWSMLKILILGGLYFYILWHFKPGDVLQLTFYFISLYFTALIFEVWFSIQLLKETKQLPSR